MINNLYFLTAIEHSADRTSHQVSAALWQSLVKIWLENMGFRECVRLKILVVIYFRDVEMLRLMYLGATIRL